MKHKMRRPRNAVPILCGLVAGVLGLFLTMGWATAAAGEPAADNVAQATAEPDATGEPLPGEAADCQECHLDVAAHWSESPHAHAYDDEEFQERWTALGEPGECLVCHTTGYTQSSGTFTAKGIQCAGCHGETTAEHPPAPVEIRADTEYCGTCHTTTLGEWRLTSHSTEGIGCSSCHDPHSQQALFAEPDDLCLNCHQEELGDHLDDVHLEKGVGCVDCHALVIPPAEEPVDGIVPTGHSFTITPATCVACHTDTLHAGSALPGYEHGAAAAGEAPAETAEGETIAVADTTSGQEAATLSPEQRVQALEASLASRNMALLFQGAIVGLVLGGSTAWLVAQNMKRRDRGSDGE